jgi:hypothetical protein
MIVWSTTARSLALIVLAGLMVGACSDGSPSEGAKQEKAAALEKISSWAEPTTAPPEANPAEIPVVAGKQLGYRACDDVCVPLARCMLAKSGQKATDCATDAVVECPLRVVDTPQYREWWANCNYECNTKGPATMAKADCDPPEPGSGARSGDRAERR